MFNEGEKRFSLWLPFSEKNGEGKVDFAHVQNVSSNRVKSTNAGARISSRKKFIRNAICVYLHFLPNRQMQTIHDWVS